MIYLFIIIQLLGKEKYLEAGSFETRLECIQAGNSTGQKFICQKKEHKEL